MTDTWLVVADGHLARIFATDAEMAELTPVTELKNHHHAGDHRHRPDEGAANHAAELKFAVEVAGEVTRAVAANEVRDVVLCAPAKFLADVESGLGRAAASHVTAKVGRDYTRLERHDLARHVREQLKGQPLSR